MKIQIKIDRLELYGFSYHEGKQMRYSIEQELGRMVKTRGLPKTNISYDISELNVDPFNVTSINAKTVGTEVARTIYHGLTQNQKK